MARLTKQKQESRTLSVQSIPNWTCFISYWNTAHFLRKSYLGKGEESRASTEPRKTPIAKVQSWWHHSQKHGCPRQLWRINFVWFHDAQEGVSPGVVYPAWKEEKNQADYHKTIECMLVVCFSTFVICESFLWVKTLQRYFLYFCWHTTQPSLLCLNGTTRSLAWLYRICPELTCWP